MRSSGIRVKIVARKQIVTGIARLPVSDRNKNSTSMGNWSKHSTKHGSETTAHKYSVWHRQVLMEISLHMCAVYSHTESVLFLYL
jgi:hypothetical protein